MMPRRPMFLRNCSICFWRRRQPSSTPPPAPVDSATSAAHTPCCRRRAPAPVSDPAELIGAEVIRLDQKSLSIRDLPELPTRDYPALRSPIRHHHADPCRRSLPQRDGNSLSVGGLPELPTSELSGFTIAEFVATTPTFAGPVIETSQGAAGVARSQATGDTQSTDAVDSAPVTMARRSRRDEEPPANDLADFGVAGTPQMTLTQSPIGVGLPAMFEASAKRALSIDLRQNASPLSKSAGLDGSAVPRSPIVDMPTSLASETATATESQPLAPLNQANDDLTTKQQVESPIAARKAPARSDDRDHFNAQSLRTEDHGSITLNDSFIANATTVVKPSDGMRRLPLTERPLEIDAGPESVDFGRSGWHHGYAGCREEPNRHGRSVAGRRAQRRQAWLAKSAARRRCASQSVHGCRRGAGASRRRSDRGETASPAWRPVVERLARDIGEHFRVGEQQAVLRLEPPELGKVKIDLRIEGGQLHVRIAAEGQGSQALIEHDLPELRQALRSRPN